MTDYIENPSTTELVKVSGKISCYKKKRLSASFVFTEADQTSMGIIAIATATAGLAGQAAIMANHASSIEEEADFIEFRIGEKMMKGWLWRSPFSDGDDVDIAAQYRGNHYEIYGVVRPLDKVIALYPHCSRGRMAHIKNAAKWYVYFCIFLLFCGVMVEVIAGERPFSVWVAMFLDSYGRYVAAGIFGFFALMVFSLSKKWMPFVRLAEKVFRVLGLPIPSNVDLVIASKKAKTKEDSPECGHLYFKY